MKCVYFFYFFFYKTPFDNIVWNFPEFIRDILDDHVYNVNI